MKVNKCAENVVMLAIPDSLLYKKEIASMPIHHKYIRTWEAERPLEGVEVAVAHVFVPNTLPMIHALLSGGADITIIKENGNKYDDRVIEVLKQEGLDVIDKGDRTFSYALDCAGYFSERQPLGGVIEVTRSGIHNYRTLPTALVDVDSSVCKLIETFLGNHKGVIRSLKLLWGDIRPEHNITIVGFGKIGRGLAYGLSRLVGVTVIDVSPEAVELARELGYHAELLTDIQQDVSELSKSDIIITATGVKGVMSRYFSKKWFRNSLLLNVGAVDEWGEEYGKEEIFGDGKFIPFNFNHDPPTPSWRACATLSRVIFRLDTTSFRRTSIFRSPPSSQGVMSCRPLRATSPILISHCSKRLIGRVRLNNGGRTERGN